MAPKHGPRGNAAGKTPPATVPGSDHIVFTNDKKPGRQKQTPESDATPAPPRPDPKKIVGGASWTGKLPGTLLSELCQRQKWNKPDYSMRQLPEADGGGYRSSVTLSSRNPKTNEITTLPPFHLPQSHLHLANAPTPLEARHFAAAYALFRVSSMKNIHMTLPPQFRDLWKGDFFDMKKEDLDAGRAWKYEADPFAAEAERQRIHVDMEKRRVQAEAARRAAEASALNLVMPGGSAGPGTGNHQPRRAWERAPKVDMGGRIRTEVEALVKSNALWNPYGVGISPEQRTGIVLDLFKLGFRRSHVEEAVTYCKDKEESLEWLLIHVPEDDLPRWTFPENYSAGISLASGDLAKEAKLKRLAAAGYSTDDCSKALQDCKGDEAAAAQALQDELCQSVSSTEVQNHEREEHDLDVWEDEAASLEAIFADRYYSKVASDVVSISSESQELASFHFRKSKAYPAQAPVIAIHSKLPAYIRLSATRQAITFAQSLLGDAMVYNIVEWLESSLPGIIESPGPLIDVSLVKNRVSQVVNSKVHGSLTMRTKRYNSSEHGSRHHPNGKPSTQRVMPMMLQRQGLPAWQKRDEIVQAIGAHQCTIISGETGSGKSTQTVQFVLDHLMASECNVVCTQPRRVAAISLADRVSAERGMVLGTEVGYAIRGESKITAQTKITFMTTGVLLRRLSSVSSDVSAKSDMLEGLADISHVFVDEVHERSLDTDFLLALLRDAMKARPDLKVVLMSATLDAKLFVDYFGREQVAQVHIPGRTFPVTDHYLDDVVKMVCWNGNEEEEEPVDQSIGQQIRSLGMRINYDLIAELVHSLDLELQAQGNTGGILIFLPGTLEIDKCISAVRRLSSATHCLPLHASLTPAEQRLVFQRPPSGKRKVVAATNVAETSITIDDIVAVIDTGRVKETNYNPVDSIVRLEEVWASQAACKQRRGRAGRVQAGSCYKLFTKNVEDNMAPRPQPEIRRVPLEQLCLSVKATGADRDVAQFLRQTLTPPDDKAIDTALSLLARIGAIDDNHLTALGRYLATIPADLRCAKLLVYGSIFCCLDTCLTIASILTVRSPFVSPRDKREEAKEARSQFAKGNHGDLLLDLQAFLTWVEKSDSMRHRDLQNWCNDHFLNAQTLRDISSTKAQLISSLKDAGIVPADYRTNTFVNGTVKQSSYERLNSQGDNLSLLRALIAGALQPQIARIGFPDKKFAASMTGAVELDPDARTIKYFNEDNGRVFVHPSSTLFDAQTYAGGGAYLSYFTRMATSKTFIRDLTRKSLPLLVASCNVCSSLAHTFPIIMTNFS